MIEYLILQNPGHNRVYYNSADKLALAELKIACDKMSATCDEIRITEIKGIRYLSFITEYLLSAEDLNLVSRLSFVFAMFLVAKIEGRVVLDPVTKINYEYLDQKISAIQKYQGKTNELFTKMMLNVAMMSSSFDINDKIKMLDPVAGRGTTMYEGVVYGYNVYGIEIESKSVNDIRVFFKKYLENERLKHSFVQRRISGEKKSDFVDILEFEYVKAKEKFKNTSDRKLFGIINGNSQDAFKYFKKEIFHLIVGDLPYGIFHGNKISQKSAGKTRNPLAFLQESIPEWFKVLRKGGVVVMAWNSFLISRDELSKSFINEGFEVFLDAPYDEFEHMVDKSVKRDIIVAKKL